MEKKDEYWMGLALELAAESGDDVPVGAILIRGEEMISKGVNSCIAESDPTAHAEIVALRAAGKEENNYRLPGTTLYVTIEPCTMCVGALIHARVEKVVYGASEPKAGALDSHCVLSKDQHNHLFKYEGGVLAEKCGSILSRFFSLRRKNQKSLKEKLTEQKS